jgi:hypothetical protein
MQRFINELLLLAIVDMLTGVEAEDEEVPLNRSTGKSVLEFFDC